MIGNLQGTATKASVAAAATAAAAASATGEASGRRGGGVAGRGEYGELNCGFLAGALGAGDLLLLVDHDFFEVRLAVVADVFVDGHGLLGRGYLMNYSNLRVKAGGWGRQSKGGYKHSALSATDSKIVEALGKASA